MVVGNQIIGECRLGRFAGKARSAGIGELWLKSEESPTHIFSLCIFPQVRQDVGVDFAIAALVQGGA